MTWKLQGRARSYKQCFLFTSEPDVLSACGVACYQGELRILGPRYPAEIAPQTSEKERFYDASSITYKDIDIGLEYVKIQKLVKMEASLEVSVGAGRFGLLDSLELRRPH